MIVKTIDLNRNRLYLFINIILYVYIIYSPPFMIFISEIAALAGTFDTESVYLDFNDPAMNDLSHTDSLAGVCDVPVRQILDVNITGDTIVQSQSHAGSFTWTSASIEVIPHLRQFGKVVLQAERTLPQTSLFVSHRIRLIKLIALWFSMTDADHGS